MTQDVRHVPDPSAASPLWLVPGSGAPLGEGVLPAEAPLDQEMVCRRVLPVTHDVVTVVLQPTYPGGVAFAPGQYVTLGLEVEGRYVERCYTVSSPPTRPHLLTLTVKRVPGGEVSAWVHDRLRVGDRVRVSGPMGGFSVAEHPAPKHLLLSAGSGITPTLSTLRTAVDLGDLGHALDVAVVHCARTPADLVCRAELEAVAADHPGITLDWVCEDDAPEQPWSGPRGRLTPEVLAALVPDVAEREVLTCGPPGFMAAARDVLAAVGVPVGQCHEESFVLGSPGAPTAVPAAGPAAVTDGSVPDADAVVALGPTVRFGRSGREVTCPPGTTVLAAAELAGVSLPSSCAEGLCGSCKQTLLSGRVEMNHQGGIRPREIAQDRFLPCCSTPDGDIVVDA